ncbi:glycosyltransferase [Micromonospora sp. NBC_01655]|uniref:glycosyltransferase n=1 Tax=Micromonospora sp. NBC_01655 TaxID=2975983 RepID=UPI00225B481B|nr:glycosyltransferase [Micromonospora sp. NBC_01655]MCX4473382.1 glycosyltransferase [Micromonospora sp. NBC_01655]
MPTSSEEDVAPPPGAAPPRLLALAAFRFPHGDAMSNRLLQLARAATPPGTPTLVVNDWPADGTRPPADPPLPPGVRLISIGGGAHGPLTRWLRWRARPLRMLAALRRAGVRPRDLTGVYLPLSLWNLTTWAVLRSATRCRVTVDVLERHDPEQFPRGRLAPYFLRHRWGLFLAGRLADRVIAVSETIAGHFVRRGRPTLVVPPQVDLAEHPAPAPPPIAEGVRLLYAGSAGPKDLLSVVLAGMRGLPRAERDRVRLVIAGFDRDRAASLSDLDEGLLTELADRVTFLGRVPRDRVLEELRRSHFSVLVRPLAGYAQAGFPSKVPESLAAGCPVLLNSTSDLGRYVVDGREGLVLAGPTADDVRDGLVRALALDDAAWWAMSRAARERAGSFDYRLWAPVVSAFVAGPGSTADGAPASSASAASSSGVSR